MDFENIYDKLLEMRDHCEDLDLLLACLKCLYVIPLCENEKGENEYLIDEEISAQMKISIIDQQIKILSQISDCSNEDD